MSKFKRYLFVKKIYPDYVVFILSKNKLITYNRDLDIYNYLKNDLFKLNINYIIVDNLELKFYKFKNNNYFYYFKLILILEIIRYIKNRTN